MQYIVFDLNEANSNCLIDPQILNGNHSSEEKDYRIQISKLITDLLVFDNPEFLMSTAGSTKAKKVNTIEEICCLDKNNRVDRNRPSGMYRIRPTTNSVARFAEQKIVLNKDTEIFRQVISIIKKYLPNVEISTEEDFSLYVNFGAAAKYSDESLYEVAMARYGITKNGIIKRNAIGSKILSLFYEDGNYIKVHNKALKMKERLSESDCLIFEQMLVNSLNTYDELKKVSSVYDFDMIDQMRRSGGKKHGLQ